MKANELRIGNLVTYGITDTKIEGIQPSYVWTDFQVGLISIKEIRGIPLTKEWTDKIDPMSNGTLTVTSDKGVLNYKDGFAFIHSGLGDDDSYGFKVKVDYVHEIQNLVTDLFKIKLNFKLQHDEQAN